MVTNVSEKDKTLHEVIDFLGKEWDAANNASDNPDEEVLKYDFYDGMTTAYEHVINYCRHLLGYSGSMPSDLNYEDIDDSSEDNYPQVGDYGVAVRGAADGQEEIPFHIEREEHTGLPVALLNTRLYAKPEDDIDDGQYVSLFQLYLDGFVLSRTGRNAAQDQSEDAKK